MDIGGRGNGLPELDLLGRVIVGEGTGHCQDCGDLGRLLRPLACGEAPEAHILDVGLRTVRDQDWVILRPSAGRRLIRIGSRPGRAIV